MPKTIRSVSRTTAKPSGILVHFTDGSHDLFEGVHQMNVSGINFRDTKKWLDEDTDKTLVLVKDEDSVDFFLVQEPECMLELERYLRATGREGSIDFINLRPA